VSSKVGKGTTFTFTFEFKKGEESEITLKKNEEQRVISLQSDYKNVKVLVVDDIEENLEVAKAILQPVGFIVETASDEKEAIVKAVLIQPAIILLDLRIPKGDILKFINEIRLKEETKNIPILAISASIFEESLDQYYESGISDFISKPYRLNEVFEKIETYTTVKYIYEAQTEDLKKVESKFTAPSTEHIPQNLIDQMLKAIKIGDIDEMEEISKKIELIDSELATVARSLFEEFEFEQLKRIFLENN
jgi:CheY-like chemotaxis protein